jgi:hypothetical protein
MRYDVTFQVGGDERVERVEAPDAASAVEAIRSAHRGTTDLFELIQVHLLENGEGAHEEPATSGARPGR